MWPALLWRSGSLSLPRANFQYLSKPLAAVRSRWLYGEVAVPEGAMTRLWVHLPGTVPEQLFNKAEQQLEWACNCHAPIDSPR